MKPAIADLGARAPQLVIVAVEQRRVRELLDEHRQHDPFALGGHRRRLARHLGLALRDRHVIVGARKTTREGALDVQLGVESGEQLGRMERARSSAACERLPRSIEAWTVVGVHAIDAPCEDIALSADRMVYCSRAQSMSGVAWLDLETGETGIASSAGQGVVEIELNPPIDVLYSRGLADSAVRRREIDSSGIPSLVSTTVLSDGASEGLRISTDGARMFRMDGNVYRSSADPDADLTEEGRLQLKTACAEAIVDSPAGDVIAALPKALPGEEQIPEVQVFHPETLKFLEAFQLEWSFSPTEPPVPGVGEFAFFSADGSRLYALYRGGDLTYVVRIDR